MNGGKYYIIGRNAIKEVLKAAPERLFRIFTSVKDPKDELLEALKQGAISISETPKGKLTQLVGTDSHQSFVAHAAPRPFVDLKTFLEDSKQKTKQTVLMLDSIFDPHNLGAILRAAECFGVELVVYSKNRGADITPVVTKTSAGASELIPLAKVSNLAEAVKAFKKADFWSMGAEVSPSSESLYELNIPEKTLLIMGSEGKGLQPILSKNCDFHAYIPMLGQIDSLNVSQATAVFLSFFRAKL